MVVPSKASAVVCPPTGDEGWEELVVSADWLCDAPPREVRRRFREERSLSSKGLGRVEQGSEETARSLGSSATEAWSIWVVQRQDAQ